MILNLSPDCRFHKFTVFLFDAQPLLCGFPQNPFIAFFDFLKLNSKSLKILSIAAYLFFTFFAAFRKNKRQPPFYTSSYPVRYIISKLLF